MSFYPGGAMSGPKCWPSTAYSQRLLVVVTCKRSEAAPGALVGSGRGGGGGMPPFLGAHCLVQAHLNSVTNAQVFVCPMWSRCLGEGPGPGWQVAWAAAVCAQCVSGLEVWGGRRAVPGGAEPARVPGVGVTRGAAIRSRECPGASGGACGMGKRQGVAACLTQGSLPDGLLPLLSGWGCLGLEEHV